MAARAIVLLWLLAVSVAGGQTLNGVRRKRDSRGQQGGGRAYQRRTQALSKVQPQLTEDTTISNLRRASHQPNNRGLKKGGGLSGVSKEKRSLAQKGANKEDSTAEDNDNGYYPHTARKTKGKGKGKGKSSKSSSSSSSDDYRGGGGGGGGGRPPTHPPPPPPTSAPVPPPPSQDDCVLELEVLFFQETAFETVFRDYANPDAQDIGTDFIYNDLIFNQTSTDPLDGSFVTGHCTRTQAREDLGGGDFIVGGGYCHFTYSLFDGVSTVTFNAAGEVFDQFGGIIGVTGGTQALQCIFGQVELLPVELSGDEFVLSELDFFSAVGGYAGDATLYVDVCACGLDMSSM